MEDADNPDLFHSSDHPGLTLVSHQLTDLNFHTWRQAMVMVVTTKNKLVFVNDMLPCPSSTDLLFAIWSRCNSVVSSWILNSVSKEIVDSLLYLDSISTISSDLYERFQQGNKPRIFQIKQYLLGLTRGTSNVSTYYTHLKILWDELKEFRLISVCTCGALKTWLSFQEQELVMQFLMGLNDSYSSIRGQILLQEPLLSLSRVFSLIVQEVRQRTLSVRLMASANVGAFNSVSSSSVYATVASKNKRPVCSHCNVVGHTVDKCYKLYGYPPGHKSRGNIAGSKSFGSQLANANQVSVDRVANQVSGTSPSLSALSTSQCQQLIDLLHSQIRVAPSLTNSSSSP